jgi:hypothetical protein
MWAFFNCFFKNFFQKKGDLNSTFFDGESFCEKRVVLNFENLCYKHMLNLWPRYRTEIAFLCWSGYVLFVLGYFGFRQTLLGFMCIG